MTGSNILVFLRRVNTSRWIYLIATLPLLSLGCEDKWEPYKLEKVILYALDPPGGMPGSLVTVTGLGFSLMPDKNTVTIDALPVEVLSASDTALTFRIPEQAPFSHAELVVASPGLRADTTLIIVSEKPLAQITGMIPEEGPPGTIVKMLGNNFNPDETSYLIIYEDSLTGFFVPTIDDGKVLNTLISASPDSLLIQIPEGFSKGRIRIFNETLGQPLNIRYTLFSSEFKVI